MPLREAVLDACFEDCGECEQGYAELGLEFLDYGVKRVDDVQSRCDQVTQRDDVCGEAGAVIEESVVIAAEKYFHRKEEKERCDAQGYLEVPEPIAWSVAA